MQGKLELEPIEINHHSSDENSKLLSLTHTHTLSKWRIFELERVWADLGNFIIIILTHFTYLMSAINKLCTLLGNSTHN